MTRDAQRLVDYLGHILEAIERIEHYVADLDEMGFLQQTRPRRGDSQFRDSWRGQQQHREALS